MTIQISEAFSKALSSAQQKFGAQNVYVADEHARSIFGVSCPLAWGWFVGGADKVPLRRIIGCDGRSGSFKSALMMEHARWFLREGGLVVIVDTEEKVSDTMVCGALFREDPVVRMNYAYAKATSVEAAQQFVTHFKSAAKDQVSELSDPSKRAPWLILWDSLTGRDTKGSQEKIEKEGEAAVRAYAEAANSIARFYKNLAFGDELLTLAHVQHVGHNMDPNAKGDDEWKPKGGDEPRYAASYHFRVLRSSDISCAEWQGKELTLKAIKSSLGPDKRKLDTRVLWKFVWIDQPVFEGEGADMSIVENKEAWMTYADAVTYYDWTQQSLSGRAALVLREFLKLDKKPKEGKDKEHHCRWPKTERIRFQQLWWDWDWALGNLLVHGIKYNEDTFAADKKDLDSVLHFVKGSNKNSVKCQELFGDEEKTLAEFGAAIEANADVRKRVACFLGIRHYAGFREANISGPSDVKRKKKAKDD